MNRVRFQELLDCRGSDLATWPEADRLAAGRLIASDPSAAGAYEQARRIDRLIQGSLTSRPFEGNRDQIASRILAGLPKNLPAQAGRSVKLPVQAAIQREPKLWALLPGRQALLTRVAALTFAAALGVALGLFWAQKNMLNEGQAMVTASEEGGTDAAAVLFPADTAIGIF
jgi:hypothetical protein